ncbi:MAG TPA: hypothetical protein VF138_07430 [Caulobacteraceae bacterium]
MKKVLISLAAVTAIAAAASPAAAAHNDRHGRYDHAASRQIDQRQAQIAQRIDRAFYRHHISRWEANQLRAELNRIEALEHRFERNGLSRAEYADLSNRLDGLQAHLREDRRDDDRYGYGYGRW